jgi:hypothetical protein
LLYTIFFLYLAPSGKMIAPNPEHSPFLNEPSYRVPLGKSNDPSPFFKPLLFQSPI